MMIGGGLPIEQIQSMMAPKVAELENEANVKLNLVSTESGASFDVVDLSKDYVRVREPNAESKVLRCKVLGVEIDVKTFKEGKFEFNNEDVVKALRSLADEVEDLPVEINTLENVDVRKDVEFPSQESEVDDADEVDSTDVEEESDDVLPEESEDEDEDAVKE